MTSRVVVSDRTAERVMVMHRPARRSSDYLYLVNGSEGLLSVDVSIPDKPVQAGQYSGLGAFSLLAVEGSYAYLASNDCAAALTAKKPPVNKLEI